MQGLLKFGDRRYNDWRCCFCCHVRTGTIFLGMWHLMLYVLGLTVIAVILRNPELAQEWEQQDNVLPTPLSEVDPPRWVRLEANGDTEFRTDLGMRNRIIGPIAMPSAPCRDGSHAQIDANHYFFRPRNFGHRRTLEDLNVIVVVIFCSFVITLFMVYGAVKGKPSYLLPFFCLQMFDFCISSLTAVGYLCYLPDMHRHLAENPHIPFRNELINLDPQVLSLIVLAAFTIAMLVKTYFIGVVWSCYKYLTLRMVATRRTVHYIEADNGVMSQSLLNDLPDYETAMKKFPAPPPSYDLATSVIPPPCVAQVHVAQQHAAPGASASASVSVPVPVQGVLVLPPGPVPTPTALASASQSEAVRPVRESAVAPDLAASNA